MLGSSLRILSYINHHIQEGNIQHLIWFFSTLSWYSPKIKCEVRKEGYLGLNFSNRGTQGISIKSFLRCCFTGAKDSFKGPSLLPLHLSDDHKHHNAYLEGPNANKLIQYADDTMIFCKRHEYFSRLKSIHLTFGICYGLKMKLDNSPLFYIGQDADRENTIIYRNAKLRDILPPTLVSLSQYLKTQTI